MRKLSLAAMALFVFLGFSGAAFAETQNVKVSGSIDAYSFYRSNYDLLNGNDAGSVPVGTATVPGSSHTGSAGQRSDADTFFHTITQVQVAVDMTDNVSTVINLINQRDWNAEPLDSTGDPSTATQTGNEFDILLDLAYVQMKEIFYSPLTLTVGRQDLLFGRGFIIGWNPQDPQGLFEADEFTQIQSFDALRATLDFNPWTLDFVYSKLDENSPNPENDRDLYIAYLTYKFAEYNAVTDLYWTGDYDRATLASASGTIDNSTSTVGARVQFDPITQMTLGGEIAYQYGEYSSSLVSAATEKDRGAWAVDLFGEYRFDNAWKPMVGLEYVFLDGEEDLSGGNTSYGSWNGSFRGPIYGMIRDYMEVYYQTFQSSDQAAGQNQQHINVYGSMKPMEDLKLTASYFYFWATDDYHSTTTVPTSATLNDSIGNEIDLSAIYSYTEDVTFTFMADWFFPGDLFISPADDTATQFVSEVKVAF